MVLTFNFNNNYKTRPAWPALAAAYSLSAAPRALTPVNDAGSADMLADMGGKFLPQLGF